MQPLVLTSFSTCLKTEPELNVETGTKSRDISPLPEEMEKIPMAPSEVKGEMYDFLWIFCDKGENVCA